MSHAKTYSIKGLVNNNPLDWWRAHSHFKLLSIVAKKILCVPATSASSERVFSDAGNVIADDRSRLTPDVASALVLLKNWEKIERMPKFISKLSIKITQQFIYNPIFNLTVNAPLNHPKRTQFSRSERVFSDAGNVIADDRSRLTPDVASALVLLKH